MLPSSWQLKISNELVFLYDIKGSTTTDGASNTEPTAQEQYHGYQINANVMSIKFKSLSEEKELHTRDAEICSNKKCTAVLNNLSTLKEEKGKSVKVNNKD